MHLTSQGIKSRGTTPFSKYLQSCMIKEDWLLEEGCSYGATCYHIQARFANSSQFNNNISISNVGSDALSGKLLLVRMIENYRIYAYFRAG